MSIKKRELEKLSLVIPCFNEEKNLDELTSQLIGLNDGRLEIIFVDDGSKDSTWSSILKIKNDNPGIIKGIKFSKNFGKEAAIEAGLKACTGNIAITLDADLEHPVDTIPKMIALWKNNLDVDIVNAVKVNRQKESFLKKLFIYFYFKVFSFSTGLELKNHTDFKLLDKVVVDKYIHLPENNKFYRGLINWLGFNAINIDITIKDKEDSESGWTVVQLIKYAKNSILSFSDLPLKSITWLGLLLFIFSIGLSIDTLIKAMNGTSAEGFPTVILLILIIGSIIIFSLGILGEYLSEIFNEIKDRPKYVISETVENHSENES